MKVKNSKDTKNMFSFIRLMEDLKEGSVEKVFADSNMDLTEFFKLLKKTDQLKQHAFHHICRQGDIISFEILLPFYADFPQTLNEFDNNFDTPLCLLSSHGFSTNSVLHLNSFVSENDQEEVECIVYKKGRMIASLLGENKLSICVSIKPCFRKGRTSILHWAIYYGDIEGGIKIFETYPMSIFHKNEDDETAFDLLLGDKVLNIMKSHSKLLAQMILERTTKAMVNKNKNFLLQNASENDHKIVEKLMIVPFTWNSNESANIEEFLTDLSQGQKFEKLTKKFVKFQKNIIENIDRKIDLIESIFDQSHVKSDSKVFIDNGFSKKLKSIIGNFDPQGTRQEFFDQKSNQDFLPKQDLDETTNLNRFDQHLKTFLPPESTLFNKGNNEEVNNSFVDTYQPDLECFALEPEPMPIFSKRSSLGHSKLRIDFVQNLLSLAIFLNHVKIARILMKQFCGSPFISMKNGLTPLDLTTRFGRQFMLNFLLNSKYKYIDTFNPFDLKSILNRQNAIDLNTTIHYACKIENFEAFVNLCEFYENKIDIYNLFSNFPHEISRNEDIFNHGQQVLSSKDNTKFDNPLIYSPKSDFSIGLDNLVIDYEYIIVALDEQPDFQSCLVYKQLKNIQKRFSSTSKKSDIFKIEYIKPLNSFNDHVYRFYFLIKVDIIIYNQIADKLDINLHNRQKGFTEEFELANADQYERFKDFHTHKMLMLILNSEFDINEFQLKGLIEDHFPVHNFKKMEFIKNSWSGQKHSIFLEAFTLKTKPKIFAPFNAIAFYFGCDYSLYVSFTVLYTSYLVIIAIPGTIFYIWSLSTGKSVDNILTAFYSLLMTVWITVVFENWKRRQNELALIWNSQEKNNRKVERPQFKGYYKIEPVTKSIIKKFHRSQTVTRLYVF